VSRALPAVHRLAPRVFYGWFVAVGASLLAFVSVGIGFYGIGVFLDALCSARGWSRASVSGATSLYFVVSGLAGTVIGRSVDRHGARGWILAGLLPPRGSRAD
jgi:MFS family permease